MSSIEVRSLTIYVTVVFKSYRLIRFLSPTTFSLIEKYSQYLRIIRANIRSKYIRKYSHYLANIRIFARILKIRYSQLGIAGLQSHDLKGLHTVHKTGKKSPWRRTNKHAQHETKSTTSRKPFRTFKQVIEETQKTANNKNKHTALTRTPRAYTQSQAYTQYTARRRNTTCMRGPFFDIRTQTGVYWFGINRLSLPVELACNFCGDSALTNS